MQEAGLRTEMLEGSSANADALSLRNILLATDFSEISTRALNYALGIAARYTATLHLYHCIDPTPYNMGVPDAVQAACEAACRDLRRLESELRSSGRARNVEIKLRVESGELAASFSEIARKLDLGLIVVGTHGRTGWRKVVLGSVAEIVVDHAACPVLRRIEIDWSNSDPKVFFLRAILPRGPNLRHRTLSRSRGNTTLGLPWLMCLKSMPDTFSQKCPESNGRNLL